jgi:hypothetical protein
MAAGCVLLTASRRPGPAAAAACVRASRARVGLGRTSGGQDRVVDATASRNHSVSPDPDCGMRFDGARSKRAIVGPVVYVWHRNAGRLHGYRRTAGVFGQEQGVGPASVRRPAADDPGRWRCAPHQHPGARPQGRCIRWSTTSCRTSSAATTRNSSKPTSRSRSPAGALPRQRLQPESRRGRGVPDHSLQVLTLEDLGCPPVFRELIDSRRA